jgi:adenylylsulfate kinase-like enzyme
MSGQIVFVAFISPYSKDRDFGRKIHKDSNLSFYECYISASLEVCEKRDVKGLYKKARAGEIKNFTGISDPYEAPSTPDLNVNTGELTLDQSVQLILKQLTQDGIIKSNTAPNVVDTLIETVSEEELANFASLKSIDIDVEQAEYL